MADTHPQTEPEVKESKLKKFLLKSWQPTPTWQSTIVLFLVLGVALIAFGIALAIINNSIVEITTWYDTSCGNQCTLTINIPKKMTGPVYMYYELTNFYQNHRRYIKSRSTTQLSGTAITASAASTDCDPIVTNDHLNKSVILKGSIILSKTGKLLDPNAVAWPCGLIAASVFTDSYKMADGKGGQISISEKDIAWDSDVNTKFKNGNLDLQWADVSDEHFIVWMRTAGLPNFRKLWGRIDNDLDIGNYTITVGNTYPIEKFNGKKGVVLSTSGPFGGKNNFLAISYIVVGSLCLLLAVFFLIRWKQLSKKNN